MGTHVYIGPWEWRSEDISLALAHYSDVIIQQPIDEFVNWYGQIHFEYVMYSFRPCAVSEIAAGADVGKPCRKLYVSLESVPFRHCAKNPLYQLSEQRMDSLKSQQRLTAFGGSPHSSCRPCNATSEGACVGLENKAVPVTGFICHQSPNKSTFNPPNGLLVLSFLTL